MINRASQFDTRDPEKIKQLLLTNFEEDLKHNDFNSIYKKMQDFKPELKSIVTSRVYGRITNFFVKYLDIDILNEVDTLYEGMFAALETDYLKHKTVDFNKYKIIDMHPYIFAETPIDVVIMNPSIDVDEYSYMFDGCHIRKLITSGLDVSDEDLDKWDCDIEEMDEE